MSFAGMPGYAFMPEDRIGTVFERAARVGDSFEQLHAPVMQQGQVLRPSIVSDVDPKQMASIVAEVEVSNFPDTVVIGLHLDTGLSEFVGRPVRGWDGHEPRTTYGDADGTDMGYSALESVIHRDGTAALIGIGATGNRRLLTGVTYDEVSSFAEACIGAINYHRSKQRRANRANPDVADIATEGN